MNNADTVFRQTFTGTVQDFIERVMAHPDAVQFSLTFLIFLCVLVFFVEVGRFMLIGFEAESVIKSTATVLFSLAFYTTWTTLFDGLFETMDNYGLLILKIGTGTSDPMFLFKFVNQALATMYQEEVSLWDMSVGDAFMWGVWKIITWLLSFVMYLIGSWAVWCLFLAKILGLLFVPMVAHPLTRPFFDGWLKFVLGSLMLLVVVRASGVLAGLAIKAQFQASGVLQCQGRAITDCLKFGGRNATINPLDSIEMSVTIVMAILIIVSSIGLSSSLASGVASPSGSVAGGAKKLAKLLSGRAPK